MNTTSGPGGPHLYVGRLPRSGNLMDELVVPITDWWKSDDGPGTTFRTLGHVALVLEPGDMTRYQLTISNARRSGFTSRPDLAIATYGPWHGTALIGGNGTEHDGINHYLCDKLGLDPRYIPARLMLTRLADLAQIETWISR